MLYVIQVRRYRRSEAGSKPNLALRKKICQDPRHSSWYEYSHTKVTFYDFKNQKSKTQKEKIEKKIRDGTVQKREGKENGKFTKDKKQLFCLNFGSTTRSIPKWKFLSRVNLLGRADSRGEEIKSPHGAGAGALLWIASPAPDPYFFMIWRNLRKKVMVAEECKNIGTTRKRWIRSWSRNSYLRSRKKCFRQHCLLGKKCISDNCESPASDIPPRPQPLF